MDILPRMLQKDLKNFQKRLTELIFKPLVILLKAKTLSSSSSSWFLNCIINNKVQYEKYVEYFQGNFDFFPQI
jgi:hypothetical protein